MASPTHVRRRSSQSTVYSHSSPTLYRSSSYQPPSRHHHHVPSTPSPPSGIPRIDEKNLDGRVVIDGLDRWSTGGDRAGNGWGVSVVRSSSEGDGLDFLSLTAKRRQALEARKGCTSASSFLAVFPAHPRGPAVLRQLVLCVSFCGLLLLALFADPHSVKSSIPAQISSLTDRITWKAQPVPPVIPVVPDNTTSLFSPIVSDVTPAPVIPDNSPAPVAPVSGPIVPETGDWSTDLHSALQSSCSSLSSTTKPYDGPSLGSTAFASFPRSGNTFLRSLVERATSFQTSSVYCDKKLQETFLGECERKNRKAERWFQKTHYPALKGRVSKVEDEKSMDWERAVVVGTPFLLPVPLRPLKQTRQSATRSIPCSPTGLSRCCARPTRPRSRTSTPCTSTSRSGRPKKPDKTSLPSPTGGM